jgi:REP-associated tyrosine transposase
MEDWMFSSFKDYVGLRNGTLSNQQLAFELFGFNHENFYADSYKTFEEHESRILF